MASKTQSYKTPWQEGRRDPDWVCTLSSIIPSQKYLCMCCMLWAQQISYSQTISDTEHVLNSCNKSNVKGKGTRAEAMNLLKSWQHVGNTHAVSAVLPKQCQDSHSKTTCLCTNMWALSGCSVLPTHAHTQRSFLELQHIGAGLGPTGRHCQIL